MTVSNASCPLGTENRKNDTALPPSSTLLAVPSTRVRVTNGNGVDVPPPVSMLRAFQLVPPEEWVRIADRETMVAQTIGQASWPSR